MAFCEGSGLLQLVQLHPSRWLSQGMRQGTEEETHTSTSDPQGLQQKVGAEEGLGRGVHRAVGKPWLASLTR